MSQSQGMGLSLDMRQSQRQRKTLEQILEQKISQRQDMQQQLQQQTRQTRSEAIGNVADGLKGVIAEMVDTMGHDETYEQIKSIISDMSSNDRILNSFIANSSYLLTPIANIKEFTAQILYANCSNDSGQVTLIASDGSSEFVKVPAALFTKALLNRKDVEKEVESLVSLIRDNSVGKGEGAMDNIRELNDALRCAGIYRHEFELWKGLIGIITTHKKDQKDDVSMIISFLQDKVLLEQLDFVITERLADRFAGSFLRKVNKRSTAESLNTLMTNLVGEYVLISMGIIDPSIFKTCKSGEVDYLAKLRPDLQKMGINLDALLRRYGLRGEGTLFWNRYYVKGMAPTAITDHLIREFITKTVRAEQGEVLGALKFEEYFGEIKETVLSREEDGKNKKEDLRRVFVGMLLDNNFSEYLVKTIKEKWKSHLAVFLKNTPKK